MNIDPLPLPTSEDNLVKEKHEIAKEYRYLMNEDFKEIKFRELNLYFLNFLIYLTKFSLETGLNIFWFGIGSKRNFLNELTFAELQDSPWLIVNGYNPECTLKSIK